MNSANDGNPESGIQVPLKKNAESSSLNPESTAWNPESKSALDSLIWGDKVHAYTRKEGGGGGVETPLLKHQKSSQPLEKGLLSPQVDGFDVTDVPQQMFFDLLRAAEKVAKIQILKIPVSKV